MTHPKVLRQQIDQCDNHPQPRCLMIHKAGVDFSLLINDRGVDPQGFGKKILAAQYKLSELEKASAASPAGQTAYETQLQAVKTLLAVVAATSSVSNS